MSAEKKRETPELNQIVKLGIRTGLFLFCPGKLPDARVDRAKAPLSTVPIRSFQVFFLCLLDGDSTEQYTVEINRTTYCRSLTPDCFFKLFLFFSCSSLVWEICLSPVLLQGCRKAKRKHNRRKEK